MTTNVFLELPFGEFKYLIAASYCAMVDASILTAS
jgi:hypothetical protein